MGVGLTRVNQWWPLGSRYQRLSTRRVTVVSDQLCNVEQGNDVFAAQETMVFLYLEGAMQPLR